MTREPPGPRSIARERRVFELLVTALEFPPEERRERLEALCTGGPVAADEVLALLARGGDLGDFLDRPLVVDPDALGAGPGPDEGSGLPERVGPFRVLERLGEGGMGSVFLAEQEEPVRRRVALKLVRGTLLSEEGRARFRAEQQALARVEHPHVARLFEAGTTGEGRPWLAMEWVDGVPITDYCDRQELGVEARLRIFVDVCRAVQHAHQKQVLHRDLKPSNVLVATLEGRPVAKVIDFGIAKALDQPLAEALSATGSRILGTPAYLSPEALRGGGVDTRSDVYSLGVLLYGLLAGVGPHDEEGRSLGEILVAIERGLAPAPSAAVQRRASRETAARRGTTVARLSRRLAGDLDAIVARATAVDPEARYASAAELAADVERHLRNEPITARRESPWSRAAKLARRRRGAVAAAALVLAALAAGTVGTTLGMLEARREAAAARRALAESEELADFLRQLFEVSDPGTAQGEELTARQLLDRGAERVRDELRDQPLVRARLLGTIGDIYGNLGLHDEARSLLAEALAIVETVHGPEHPDAAAALHALGVVETKVGRFDEAKPLFERALAIQRAALGPDDPDLAKTRYHLGVLAFRAKDLEAAEELFDRACDAWRGAADQEASYARCLEGLAAVRRAQGRTDDAERLFQETLELRIDTLGDSHPHVALTLSNLCALYSDQLRFAEAADACRRADEVQRRVLGDRHPERVRSLLNLANLQGLEGRHAEAVESFREAVSIADGTLAPDHSLASRLRVSLAWNAWLLGRLDTAEAAYREALESRRRAEGPDSSRLTIPTLGLGLVRWKRGEHAEAEALLLEARERARRDGEESSDFAWSSWALAGLYADRADPARGDLERSKELYEEALRIRRASYPEGHPTLRQTEADYAALLRRIGGSGAGSPAGE